MPHVTIKLWPGETESQKQDLALRITQAVTQALECDEESVSIALEEIAAADWAEQVYRTDVLSPKGTLYKKPGYRM